MAMKLKQTSGCNLFVMLQAQLRLYVQAAGQVLNEYIRNKMGIATVTVTYAIKITHTHVNMNACTVPKHIQPCFPIDFVMFTLHNKLSTKCRSKSSALKPPNAPQCAPLCLSALSVCCSVMGRWCTWGFSALCSDLKCI